MTKALKTLVAVAVGAVFATSSGVALATDYPSKPIRLVVPFAPGGAVDHIGRTLSKTMGELLGQSVVVENRAGASGSVGAAEIAKSAPDGYTFGIVLDSHAVNHHTIKGLSYDTFESFDYLSLLVTLPLVLVTRSDFPVQTVPELVEYIKQNDVSYGTAGTGSAAHVNAVMMSSHFGLEATHIPYRGAGPLQIDLLGGHVDFAFSGLSVMLSQIEAGALNAVAVSSAERSSKLPEVPALAESIPGYDIPSWIGMVAPAGVPDDIKEKVLNAAREALSDPEIRKNLENSSFNVVVSSPDEFLARAKQADNTMRELISTGTIQFEQ